VRNAMIGRVVTAPRQPVGWPGPIETKIPAHQIKGTRDRSSGSP